MHHGLPFVVMFAFVGLTVPVSAVLALEGWLFLLLLCVALFTGLLVGNRAAILMLKHPALVGLQKACEYLRDERLKKLGYVKKKEADQT